MSKLKQKWVQNNFHASNGPLLPDQKQTEAGTDLSLRKQNVELGVH